MKDPIAIVGIGCRFPGGVERPEDLYRLALEGRSAIVDIPRDRWDNRAFFHPDFAKPGHIHVQRGGFLDEVDHFDAAFFGIAPNEARRMDPQQRLVLECAYRAIEDAGMSLRAMAGTDTAVFVGVSGHDYDAIQGAATERHHITGTTNTGSAMSIVANRVSYVFDLRGPSMAVDTACSSALYAVHSAVQAMRAGHASMALVGGVNLILKPEPTIGFSTGGYLSPDAECRAFSDDANGYVRGEGAGIVLLKRLSAALDDGDRIYAVIRGSWANQDGRSLGMTMPNEEAQLRMLEAAYRDADVDPALVDCVEAHGTGTPAGDPIEARALGRALCLGRGRARPLVIGSIKTNIGHLESAAGAAGLIKLALTLQRGVMPPNRNFRAPNPEIPFDELQLAVPVAATALRRDGDRPLFGGVNGFGFGGANAHVVLSSPPAMNNDPVESEVLAISAQTRPALVAIARTLLDSEAELAPMTAALQSRRTGFEHRYAIPLADARDGLRSLVEDAGEPRGHLGRASAEERVAFVFGGQGPQHFAMGRELLQRSAAFRAVIDRVDAALTDLGWLADERSGLRQELARDEATSRIHQTQIAQPALFAVQMGIAAELAVHGIRPHAVVGHSIGELAAAATAGALSFDEAVRLVYWRSRAQARAEGHGAMIAVGLGAREVTHWLAKYGGRLELAADNGPSSVTIAGTHDAAQALFAELEAADVFVRRLAVSVPFHCFLMDSVESDFRAGLGAIERAPTGIPFYSTVTASTAEGEALDVDYWYRNIREPVRFTEALSAMIDDGLRTFVEIGPHPILRRGAEELLEQRGVRGAVVPTLQRRGDDARAMADARAQLFVRGVPFEEPGKAPHVDGLPIHPFAKERLWLETARGHALRTARPMHPILRRIERTVGEESIFRVELAFDAEAEPYLAEHLVQKLVVVPGAAQLEAIWSAAREAFPERELFLEDVALLRPIVLPERGDAPEVRLEVRTDEGHFVIASCAIGTTDWVVHTRGRINHSGDRYTPTLHDDVARGPWQEIDAARMFDEAAAAGLALGPSFRGIRGFRVRGATTVASIELSASVHDDASRYAFHPALLDSVIQTAAFGPLSATMDARTSGLYLPHRVGRTRIFAAPRGAFRCEARITEERADELEVSVRAFDSAGLLLVAIDGLVVKYIEGTKRDPARDLASFRYELRWQPDAGSDALRPSGDPWLMLSDERIGPALARAMRSHGHRVIEVRRGHTVPEDLGSIVGIVHLRTIGAPSFEELRTDGLSALVAIVEEQLATQDRLLVRAITANAWPVVDGDRADGVAAASLWGLGRVMMSEEPRAEITLVDIDPNDPVEALAREVLRADRADEVALRAGRRFLRSFHVQTGIEEPRVELDAATHAFAAAPQIPGILDSVCTVARPMPNPEPHEVRIAVRAVGLNFKDVVVAMDMLPLAAWRGGLSGAELGLDCAGVISAVGSRVTRFTIGDEVIALAPRCLGNVAVTDARLVVRKPRVLSFAEAASIPTVFLTAEIALRDLARVREGETILVHAAAGGVGSAAIQVARRLGAKVLGTASTDEKAAYARGLGASAIFDSRRSSFKDEVLEATDGRGADVVLNSLSGRALAQGIRALAPFGRFVEIGKADVYANRQIGLEWFGENRSYHCLDINRFAAADPARIGATLEEIVSHIESGRYVAAPVRSFPIERAAEALASLASGKHIGKVVVEVPAAGPIEAHAGNAPVLDPDGSYLVTGGCGGFGLAVAERLAQNGARCVVLVGRRGLVWDAERAIVDELGRRGVTVHVRAADIGDANDVEHLFTEVTARWMPPLRGIFHCAMVLDDAPLAGHDDARFARVLHPKMIGAHLLHRASATLALDHFVLFSSIASVIGTPGQAAYAAANAYLDGLAQHRRANGLPAVAINWGVLTGTGVVERADAAQRAKILNQGVGAFSRDEALAILDRLLVEGLPQSIVADIDWTRVIEGSTYPGSRFGSFVSASGTARATGGSLRERVLALPENQRADAVTEWLLDAVAKASGQARENLEPEVGLDRLGLDSLMGARLRSAIKASFGVEVALVRLLRGSTARALATEIAQGMNEPTECAAPPRFEWVRRLNDIEQPRARLFVVPPMAADGSAYATWSRHLRADIELCAVERPDLGGPGDALLRGPYRALSDAMIAAAAPFTDLPFGIYGHSMGGWIALELAAGLHEKLGRAPVFIGLGALPTDALMRSVVPSRADRPEAISDTDVARISKAFGIPDVLLEDRSLRNATIARMRRDLWLGAASGRFAANARIPVPAAPVLRFGGSQDSVDTVRDGQNASVVTIPGTHLFHQEPRGRAELLAQLIAAFGGT